MVDAEGVFLACIVEDGTLDKRLFREACDAHPALTTELRDLRQRFTLGARLAGIAAMREPLEARELLRRLEQDGRDTRRFHVGEELGRGGMGVVLRVWDPELRRPVALKHLRPRRVDRSRAGDERARLRLLEEAQVLGQLQHPGIVPVLELGRDERAGLFFTMPLVEGATFGEIIDLVHEEGSDWSHARAVGTLLRVSEAVAYAHSRGVLHRDLKPENVMVGSFGETYVMDWGLAKVRGEDDTGEDSAPGSGSGSGSVSSLRHDLARVEPSSPLLSRAGEVVGTPSYMAPEQARGERATIDERVDVYGLGAILYHLLAHRAPYRRPEDPSPSYEELLERVRRGPPAPLSSLARRAPEELVSICERAMARSPGERYPSIEAMGADLRAHLEGRVVHAHAVGPWVELRKWTRRHRMIVALLAVVGLLVVGSAVGFALLYQESVRQGVALRAAQADALRRLGSLQGTAPSTRPSPSFRDGFDDDYLDRRWVVTSNPERVSERAGQLRVEAGPASEGATQVLLDPFVDVLRGDIEVTVRFTTDGLDVPDVERAERAFVVELVEPGSGALIAGISRNAERHPLACGGIEQSYRSSVSSSRVECAPATFAGGWLRMERSGGAVVASFRDGDGDWVPLGQRPVPEGAATLRIFCRNWYTDEPFAALLDEVSVRVRDLPTPEPVTDFRLERTTGALDSRLHVSATAGIVAAIDGSLYLEKLEGRSGYVRVALDPTRWELRGDFEVSFSFDMPEFPVPEDKGSFLSLRVQSGGAPFGTIELHRTSKRLFYKAFYHVTDESRDATATNGRMRIRREARTLHFDIWDGSWQTLLSREQIPETLAFQFMIELDCPTDERSVVAVIDDLAASSLHAK